MSSGKWKYRLWLTLLLAFVAANVALTAYNLVNKTGRSG